MRLHRPFCLPAPYQNMKDTHKTNAEPVELARECSRVPRIKCVTGGLWKVDDISCGQVVRGIWLWKQPSLKPLLGTVDQNI